VQSVPVTTEAVFGVNLALLAVGGYLFVKLRSMLALERHSAVKN
jgi:hypothetical protein